MTLTLKNVTKIIRKNTVVDDVSVTMKSGMVYGLCGYNGCGKTMLMRLIAGLIIPNSGEILFDGKKIAPRPIHWDEMQRHAAVPPKFRPCTKTTITKPTLRSPITGRTVSR